MANNWFTNVATPIYTNMAVRGLVQTGTELCCFTPEFEWLNLNPDGNVHAHMRTWHNEPIIIESSIDLKQWAPSRTNTPALPLSEIELADGARVGREFFRMRKIP